MKLRWKGLNINERVEFWWIGPNLNELCTTLLNWYKTKETLRTSINLPITTELYLQGTAIKAIEAFEFSLLCSKFEWKLFASVSKCEYRIWDIGNAHSFWNKTIAFQRFVLHYLPQKKAEYIFNQNLSFSQHHNVLSWKIFKFKKQLMNESIFAKWRIQREQHFFFKLMNYLFV